jgi:hypothetical protein
MVEALEKNHRRIKSYAGAEPDPDVVFAPKYPAESVRDCDKSGISTQYCVFYKNVTQARLIATNPSLRHDVGVV